MAKSVSHREITTIADFVQAVEDFSDEDDVLFRGQQRNDWDLGPSIGRLELRTHSTHLQAESALIKAFRQQCTPFVAREPKNDWELLALAQHHGLATRLLDWTANPLAALWFTVRHPAVTPTAGCVLMFALEDDDHVRNPDKESPFKLSETRFFQPNHLAPRIVAQSGWFSVHAWNSSKRSFQRLNRLSTYKSRIEYLDIPPDHFAALRASLDRLGINDATLFPDLDGLTSQLNWRMSVLQDEL